MVKKGKRSEANKIWVSVIGVTSGISNEPLQEESIFKYAEVKKMGKYTEMITCKNLFDLEEKHGNYNDLLKTFEEASKKALDKESLRTSEIEAWENILSKQKNTVTEWQNSKLVYNPSGYRKAGYDYALKGYAIDDLKELINRDISLKTLVKDEHRLDMGVQILDNLARGASIARYVTYLKNIVELSHHYGPVSQAGKRPRKKKEATVKNLQNIWKMGDSHYDRVIDFLCESSPSVGSAFVLKTNGTLKWENVNSKFQYMAAFIKTSIVRGFIENNYSSTDIKNIIENTFGVSPKDAKPFKSLHTRVINPKYLDPFNNLPNK